MEKDLTGACGSTSGGTSAGETSAGECEGEEREADVAAGDREAPMEALPENVKVGGVTTAVDAWLALGTFLSHMYTDFDDRSMAEREKHGEEGQKKGKAWADALNRHTQNNANWFYPHDSAYHYKQRIVACGSYVRGDDSIIETKHKVMRAQKRRLFGHGARRSNEKWTVDLHVPSRDARGNIIPDKFHITTYTKRANAADFQAMQRREAVINKLSESKLPPLITTPREVVKKEKAKRARQLAQETSQQSLKDLRARAAQENRSTQEL